MTAIAWAIFCAALILMPARNRNLPNWEYNNAFDCTLLFIGILFLIYYSGKP